MIILIASSCVYLMHLFFKKLYMRTFLILFLLSKRNCEKEIDWYKSVKETQGSVEATSFGQMRSINRLGQYTIGSTKRGISTSRGEVISLRLVETRGMKGLLKVHYTLDELRDLESKLVLITGRDSLERNEVDQFLKVN